MMMDAILFILSFYVVTGVAMLGAAAIVGGGMVLKRTVDYLYDKYKATSNSQGN